MSINFTFSRGYGEFQTVQSPGACCSSNTNSADVLLEQQGQPRRVWGHMPADTGGL